MSIFVTGGAGFIGSQFIRQWFARRPGDSVINFDKLTYAGNLENLISIADEPNYSLVKGDVCDARALYEAIPHACDAVIHFAAESHVDRSILSAEEFVRTNVLGTQVLLDVARERRVGRFLHISTDEVGGSMRESEFFTEEAVLKPSSPYAASKAAAEHLVRAAGHTFGMDVQITRTSNNYGPYQFPEKLIPLAVTNALEDTPIPVYGDGRQVRDWLHVEDNCRALMLVLEQGKSGETYHIGGGCPVENLTVLRLLLSSLNKPETFLTFVKDRPGHDRRYAVDCSKLREQLGWSPSISLEAGLRRTVDWYWENGPWVSRARSGEYRLFYDRWYGAVTS